MDTAKFYVGISKCGCVSAMLVDDESTTPKEIAQFARRMGRTFRTVEHRELDLEKVRSVFDSCPHHGAKAND